MLVRLDSARAYTDFIKEINNNSSFKNPMLSFDEQMNCNLFDVENKKSTYLFGIFEGQIIIGLFVFLILEDEKYIEMLFGLSKEVKAYNEILEFLKEEYKGYKIDFVYNPNNYLLHKKLQNEKAEFEIEQQKMILKNDVIYNGNCHVELYTDKYKEQYIAMHSTDVYWAAEKVIEANDIFRIILAIENDNVVGYVDVTHKYEENEPYDVLVKPEFRRKGYGKALLAKAIELNKPKDMMLLVNIDNIGAIKLYESMGFETVADENTITAHLMI